jgi:hypothetical protein
MKIQDLLNYDICLSPVQPKASDIQVLVDAYLSGTLFDYTTFGTDEHELASLVTAKIQMNPSYQFSDSLLAAINVILKKLAASEVLDAITH